MVKNEKIYYESDRGESITVEFAFPYFLEKVEGADGLSSNLTTVKGINQDGYTITNTTLQPRTLVIYGRIKGTDKEDIARQRAELLKVFNPKIKGWLEYTYGDVVRRIRCQVDTAPIFSKLTKSCKYQSFIVNLIAPNPYWLSDETSSEEMAAWVGGFRFPLVLPTTFSKQGQEVLMTNEGQVDAPVEIKFYGPATNPKITNITTGEYIRVKQDLQDGEVLYINTGYGVKEVTLIDVNGTESNAMHYLDLNSVFWSLEVGDNIIEYDADANVSQAKVLVQWRNRYTGI